MKSVNISIKYSSVAVTKFVCKEIWQKNHFTLLQEKESKLLYSRYSFFIPFNEQQKCHVTNIYTKRKNSETQRLVQNVILKLEKIKMVFVKPVMVKYS